MPDLPEQPVSQTPEARMDESSQGSLLSRMIEGVLSIGAATMTTMTLGLVTTMVVVRRLPANEYGVFVLLMVSSIFLSEASSFGLTLAVPTFIAGTEDQQQRGDLIVTAVSFRLLLIALVGVVILITRPVQLILPDSSDFAGVIFYVPLLFGLDALGKSFKSILQGLFRFKIISMANLLASVCNFLLIGVFVLLLDQGLIGLVHAKAISLAALASFAFLSIPRRHTGAFRIALLKKLLVFGFPLELQYILTFIYSRVDTFIIGTLLGPVGIAYYEVARRIPESISELYEAFRMVYFPFAARLFARNELRKLVVLLNHSIRAFSFLTMLGTLVALLFGNEIFGLLFSEKYLHSASAFVILMFGLNLTFTEYTLGYSLVALGQSDKPLIVNVVRTLINVACNLMLIPGLGFVGAAAANVLSNLVVIPLDLIFLRKKGVIMGVADYLKPIIVFAICGLMVLLLGPAHYLLRAAILFLYMIGCMLLSVITIEELALVYQEITNILYRLLGKRRYERFL